MRNLEPSKVIALKLTSLNQSDFDWVYAQLSQDVKDSLNPLIQEINSIGFKVDSRDIDALTNHDIRNKLLGSREQESNSSINNASYEEILHLFKLEPAFLFKTLSNLGNWGWAQDPQFINNAKVNATKEIKSIESKKLLAKSISSTAAIILSESKKNNLKDTQVEQFKMGGLLSNLFNDFSWSRNKWRF